MHRLVAIVLPGVLCALLGTAEAQPLRNQQPRYPRVYGPTGSTYGPTQAHYQYQRQYGRPWHGLGGQTYSQHHHSHVPAYGVTTGYPGYGFGFGVYAPYPQPYLYPNPGIATFSPYYYANPGYSDPWNPAFGQPSLMGPANPFENPVLGQSLEEEFLNSQYQLMEKEQFQKQVPQIHPPSSPETKLRALRLQEQGDHWMSELNYANAYKRYRAAQEAAPDLADAYFRLAYALVAAGQYERAIAEFKSGLRLQPDWPQTGYSLEKLLGPDNVLARSVVMTRLVDWVKLEIRDPDRLFLAGVMLNFERPDQTRIFMETAWKLSGGGDHLALFLQPVDPQQPGLPGVEENPQPALPQANPNAFPSLPGLPGTSPAIPADPRDLQEPQFQNTTPAIPEQPTESPLDLPPPLPAPDEVPTQPPLSLPGPVIPNPN